MPRNKKYVDPVSLHGTTERHLKEKAEDILREDGLDLNTFLNCMMKQLVERKIRFRLTASPVKRRPKSAPASP